jgi:hypothetical protein
LAGEEEVEVVAAVVEVVAAVAVVAEGTRRRNVALRRDVSAPQSASA